MTETNTATKPDHTNTEAAIVSTLGGPKPATLPPSGEVPTGTLVTLPRGGKVERGDAAKSIAPLIYEAPIDATIFWAKTARNAEIMGSFARVMTGYALLETKRQLGITAGSRSDLSTDARLANGWDSFLKDECGIGRTCAKNWMDMAELAAPKIAKLGGFRAEEMLSLGAVDAEKLEAIHAAVQKLCTGKDYTELGRELGLFKLPQGAAGKGGKLPALPDAGPEASTLDPDKPAPGWEHEADAWAEYCKLPTEQMEQVDIHRPTMLALEQTVADQAWVMLPSRHLRRLVAAAKQLIADAGVEV